MIKEQLDSIRETYKTTKGDLYKNIFGLLEALEEMTAERDHYKDMFEAIIKKGAQVEADRDRYKTRTEALARAVSCGSCSNEWCPEGIRFSKQPFECPDWEFEPEVLRSNETRFAAMPEVSQ